MQTQSSIDLAINNESRKKIIIVNNNMKIGGIQKALLNLLNEISSLYDVTLCLLNNAGEYSEKLPKGVKVVECNSLYKYFGMSQAESKQGICDFVCRTSLAVMMRFFGRKFTTRFISIFSKKIDTEYDCAISYMHDSSDHTFYGGCNDFVLSKINSKKKITFLHCDYENYGGNYKFNNEIYENFDVIAACSEGCRQSFLRVIPHLEHKTKTVINCHNFEEIIALSNEDAMIYDDKYVNAIVVARLGQEKGVDRAIRAVRFALDRNAKVKLHIVGNGMMMDELKRLSAELGVCENVVFYGAQTNPYRYMKNADFLFVPSYHEAAPLVIDEALCLGVPVLSTRTTSSEDMILHRYCGWVCENNQDGINNMFCEISSNIDEILAKKNSILSRGAANNGEALTMFEEILF